MSEQQGETTATAANPSRACAAHGVPTFTRPEYFQKYICSTIMPQARRSS